MIQRAEVGEELRRERAEDREMSGTFGTQTWEAAIGSDIKVPSNPPIIIPPLFPSFHFFFFVHTWYLPYLVEFAIYSIYWNNFRYVLAAQQVGELSRETSEKADFASRAEGPAGPHSVPLCSVPLVQIDERRSTERSGLTACAWKSGRLPQLSDETASYRCAYRVRAVVCTWRVRDKRVLCERSPDFTNFLQD